VRWLPVICYCTGRWRFRDHHPFRHQPPHITTTGASRGDGWVLNGRKIYISSSTRRTTCSSRPRRGRQAGKPKPVLFVVLTMHHGGFERARSLMEIVTPTPFHVFPSTDVLRPTTRCSATRRRARTALRRAQPRAEHAASFATGLARFRAGEGSGVTPRSDGSSRPDRPHQPSRTARPVENRDRARTTMTQKAAALYARATTWRGGAQAANMASTRAARPACDAADRPADPWGQRDTRSTQCRALLSPRRAPDRRPSRSEILTFVAMHFAGAAQGY